MGYVWIPTQASWTIDMVGRLPAKTHQWRTLWHENPYYQWNVATGPNLRFQVGNERIVLNRGDCLLLQPGTRHTGWGPDEDGTGFYFIRFMTDPSPVYQKIGFFSQLTESRNADEYLVIPELGRLENDNAIKASFAEIVHEWLEQRPFYRMYISTLLQHMLLTAMRSGIMPLDDTGDLRLASTRRMEVLKQVLEYIDKHCYEPFQVSAMCRELDLDYKYVARVFKAGMGSSIIEYLHRKRIAKARMLLHNGFFHTIAEVGAAVGYNDPYYFSRVFHKIEGISPKEYLSHNPLNCVSQY